MPIMKLKSVLQKIEKVAFSAQMMKIVVKRGAREPPREHLQHMFEMVTGLDSGQPLFEGKADEDFEAFEPVAVQLSVSRGRPGQDLVLKADGPDFTNHGPWEVVDKTEPPGVYLKHRFHNKYIQLPDAMLDFGLPLKGRILRRHCK